MVSRKALEKTSEKGLGGPGNLCIYLAGKTRCPFHFVTESTQQADFAKQPAQVSGEGTGQLKPLPLASPPPKSSRGFPFHFLPVWEGGGQHSLWGQALKNHFLCGWGRASSWRMYLGVPV